eukprot:169120-Hanusia_phi.AAC.1
MMSLQKRSSRSSVALHGLGVQSRRWARPGAGPGPGTAGRLRVWNWPQAAHPGAGGKINTNNNDNLSPFAKTSSDAIPSRELRKVINCIHEIVICFLSRIMRQVRFGAAACTAAFRRTVLCRDRVLLWAAMGLGMVMA